jgi:hypothetical protein
MAMRIPATDYEWGNPPAGVTEEEFDKGKDLWEGINGHDRFNSHFENTERNQVLAPRGDARGRPMPRDARFQGADNHGEWGNDRYMRRLEYGMDGPDSKHSYHGAGLPTRHDLSYPANRDHLHSMEALSNEKVEAQAPLSVPIGKAPSEEAIDGDN